MFWGVRQSKTGLYSYILDLSSSKFLQSYRLATFLIVVLAAEWLVRADRTERRIQAVVPPRPYNTSTVRSLSKERWTGLRVSAGYASQI